MYSQMPTNKEDSVKKIIVTTGSQQQATIMDAAGKFVIALIKLFISIWYCTISVASLELSLIFC